ncbi:MAG: hypothetical protein OXG44_21330 [Gammaproteobacteria bacterium]|nr:hypothetical protein [Gammaproteobacteria bacterium]
MADTDDDDFDTSDRAMLEQAVADPEFAQDRESLEAMAEQAGLDLGEIEQSVRGEADSTNTGGGDDKEENTGSGDTDAVADSTEDAGKGGGEEGGDTTAEESTQADTTGETKTEGEADAGTTGEGEADTTGEQIDGVLTRDGKNFMPFRVVEEARSAASTFRQERDDARAELARLKGTGETGDGKTDRTDASTEGTDGTAKASFTEEQFAELEESYGKEFVAPLRAQQQLLNQQSQQLDALKDDLAESRQSAEDAKLIDAINQVPELLALPKDSPLWVAVDALDAQLAQSDEWKGRSDVDRIRHVVKELKLDGAKPVPETKTDTVKNSRETQEQAEQRQAEAENRSPSSLGSLNTGTDATGRRTLADMTPEEVDAALEGKSDEDVERMMNEAFA